MRYDVDGLERDAHQAMATRASYRSDYLRISEEWLAGMQQAPDPDLGLIGRLLVLAGQLRHSLRLPVQSPPVV
jgi:hypothetical protein